MPQPRRWLGLTLIGVRRARHGVSAFVPAAQESPLGIQPCAFDNSLIGRTIMDSISSTLSRRLVCFASGVLFVAAAGCGTPRNFAPAESRVFLAAAMLELPESERVRTATDEEGLCNICPRCDSARQNRAAAHGVTASLAVIGGSGGGSAGLSALVPDPPEEAATIGVGVAGLVLGAIAAGLQVWVSDADSSYERLQCSGLERACALATCEDE